MSQKDWKRDNKKLLSAAAPNILISFIIIGMIMIFKPGFLGLLLIISSVVLIQHIKNKTEPKRILYSLIHSWFYITIIYSLWNVAGNYGLVGYVGIIVLISFWRMYANRKIMMRGLRQIETMIFGKSLDKENWKDNKPRLPKLKKRKD